MTKVAEAPLGWVEYLWTSAKQMFSLFFYYFTSLHVKLNHKKNPRATCKWDSSSGYFGYHLPGGDIQDSPLIHILGSLPSKCLSFSLFLCKNAMTSAIRRVISSWPAQANNTYGRLPRHCIFIFISSNFHSNSISPLFLSNPPESLLLNCSTLLPCRQMIPRTICILVCLVNMFIPSKTRPRELYNLPNNQYYKFSFSPKNSHLLNQSDDAYCISSILNCSRFSILFTKSYIEGVAEVFIDQNSEDQGFLSPGMKSTPKSKENTIDRNNTWFNKVY